MYEDILIILLTTYFENLAQYFKLFMFLKIILLTCHVLLIIKMVFKTPVLQCNAFDKQSSGRLRWLVEQEKAFQKLHTIS